MPNSISLRKLLYMNVREIEELFGKERSYEIMSLLRKHEKIREKDKIEKELKKKDEERNVLIFNLEKTNAELENTEIAY
ncbi:MAG: hypothetical protein WA063_05380 [Minisyncoccia bacterium]